MAWTKKNDGVVLTPKLTNYLNSGNKIPKKEDIVVIHGRLGEDIIFIEKMHSLKDKIYMKLSEIK